MYPILSFAIVMMAVFGFLGGVARGADLVLRFPDDITWKGVFDSGFRPKHVSGLQRHSCEVIDQSFQFQLKGKPELFPLDRGLLTFQLKADNGIRQIWHQSRVPVSMDEGRRRLEQFEKLVEGFIFQKGRMPVLLDKATATIQTEREFDSIAHVDGYIINFGFDSSFVEEAPLIPHFYVTWRGFAPRELIRKEVVTPPEGYEWYSLDPKVDTPAPGISRPMSVAEKPTATEQPRPAKRNAPPPPPDDADEPRGLPLGLILLIVAAIVVVVGALISRARKAGKAAKD